MLAAAGIAAASPGCMSVLGDESAPESTEEPAAQTTTEPGAVRLGELSVQNNHDSSHRIQLAVSDGEEVLHMGTYDLEASGTSTTIDGKWNDAADTYRIHARLDDGEIRTADVAEGISEEANCVRVLARIDDRGTLGIWNGAGCS
jgi:hypothetical protein